MSEIVAIEVTDEEVAWLCDVFDVRFGEPDWLCGHERVLLRKVWGALPVTTGTDAP